MELVEYGAGVGHWVSVGNGDCVEPAVIDTEPYAAVGLEDGDDGAGPRGRAALDDQNKIILLARTIFFIFLRARTILFFYFFTRV